MSNKRPFPGDQHHPFPHQSSSPAAFSPPLPSASSASTLNTPGLGPRKKLIKSSKRRKSSQSFGNSFSSIQDRSLAFDATSTCNPAGTYSCLGQPPLSTPFRPDDKQFCDHDETDLNHNQARKEEPEEEEAQKALDDDDYSIKKREDLVNKEKLRILLEHFDDQQRDRYTEYRNSGLAKASVRKLANSILQQSVSDRVTIVTRGLAKVFVGHMVEKALEVQRRRGGSGLLTQADLREAYRAHLVERDRGGSDRQKLFTR